MCVGSSSTTTAESKWHFDAAEYDRQLKATATNADNDPLARHLRELEESLLQPDVRKSERLVELLADDFIELGSSGRAHDIRRRSPARQDRPPSRRTTSRRTAA